MEWLAISISPVLLFVGGVVGKWFEKNTASKTAEIQASVEFTRMMMERVNRLSEKTDELCGELENQRLEINALQKAVDSAESILKSWKLYSCQLFRALRDTGRSAPSPPDEIRDEFYDNLG